MPGSEHVFPPPRFPAGVGVAPAVLLAVLLAGGAGLALLSVPGTDPATGASTGGVDRPGLVAGVSVAVAGIWAYLALRTTIVGPVRRLRDDLEARVRDGEHVPRASFTSETERVVTAIRGTRRGRTLSAVLALVLVGAGLVSWLVAATVLVGERPRAADEVAAEGRRTAGDVALAVRHELENGLGGLTGVAAGAAGLDPGTVAGEVLVARPVFDAATVLDPAGDVVGAAGTGRAVLRTAPAPGITLLNTRGPEPILVAAAPLADGNTLVGEYDVRTLNELLRGTPDQVAVVDPGMRTVLRNTGYRAFADLSDPEQRSAAEQAARPVPAAPLAGPLPGAPPGAGDAATAGGAVTPGAPVTPVDGTVAAARRIGFQDATAALGWVVVVEQDLRATAVSQDAVGRSATAICGVCAAAVLFLLAWTWVGTVRPLRGLGGYAEAIAGIPEGGVAPAPRAPQRVNEAGAIAAAMNRRLITLLRERAAAGSASAAADRESADLYETVCFARITDEPAQAPQWVPFPAGGASADRGNRGEESSGQGNPGPENAGQGNPGRDHTDHATVCFSAVTRTAAGRELTGAERR
ncbi:hypothetical protein [Pseudonocardia phyllosphaerae]|uniref:hypothetical protein n=1 Tax=Pseudonocardia phyllosphaerae TaxID=3390502 RepID=UPI00397BFAB1